MKGGAHLRWYSFPPLATLNQAIKRVPVHSWMNKASVPTVTPPSGIRTSNLPNQEGCSNS